jgi:hypothetical protein
VCIPGTASPWSSPTQTRVGRVLCLLVSILCSRRRLIVLQTVMGLQVCPLGMSACQMPDQGQPAADGCWLQCALKDGPVVPCCLFAMSCCATGAWAADELDRLKNAVTKYMAARQEFLQHGRQVRRC